jgi:alkylhydroperoxidase family enzyme
VEKTKAVLADWRTAPIDEKLRATLQLIEKTTLRPDELTPADAASTGCSAEELTHAIYVAYLFNIYDRLADAMGWTHVDEARYQKIARILLKRGYEPGAPNIPPDELRRQLERRALEGPGTTTPALRQAAAAGEGVPPELAALVAKTHQHAYRVTEEEISALRAQFSDDQLFEVIVAAAIGASAKRAKAAFALLAAP